MTSPAAEQPEHAPPRLRVVAGLLALCAALLAPFLAKPFNIDEPLFIWCARQIANHPFDPYGFTGNWQAHEEPFWRFMQNPPLASYYLAAIGRWVGWTEVPLHVAMLALALAAVAGTYQLACGFCRRPGLASVLAVGSATFLVSATTVMCDVPLLCLWVWAVVTWVRGSAERSTARPIAWLSLSTALVVAAVMTKYPAINLVPLLACQAVLCPAPRRSTRAFQAGLLCVPVIALFLFDRITANRYGVGLIRDAVAYSSGAGSRGMPVLTRALNNLCFLGGGGLTIAAVAGLALFRRHAVGWLLLPAVAAGLGWLASVRVRPPVGWSWPVAAFFAQYGLLAALGLLVAVGCAAGCRWSTDRRRGLFLLAWVAGVFVFACVFNWTVNARSILPLIPAASILAVRGVDRVPSLLTGGLVAMGALVAVVLCAVDQDLATANRVVADQWAKGPAATDGHGHPRVWFAGHWGFQYYMQLGGAIPVDDRRRDYAVGDWVVAASNNYRKDPPAPMERVDVYDVGPGGWLATMDYAMGGGFYFSSGDRLPFVIAPIAPQRYTLSRITGPATTQRAGPPMPGEAR